MLPKITKPKKNIYLDHAAATPLDPQVQKAMTPFWHGKFGNPSALYSEGKIAKSALDEARAEIASLINARGSEIIFTAGGTESVNLAIFGVTKNFNPTKKKYHLITSAIEHHCVLNSFKALEGEGYKTTFVGVDDQGFIKLDELKKSVRPETIFISVMLANNEIGTIEPVIEIGKWLKGLNIERAKKSLPQIIFHTDACQAAGFLDLNVHKLGMDLMSVNGSKIYGPKQTGFLYVKSGIQLKPIIYGGGQEKDLRSGTENVAGAVGLAKAFELVQKNRDKESKRLTTLRDGFIKDIRKVIPQALLNGPDREQLNKRLPNSINFSFKGLEGEVLMLYLDGYGISASTSSACTTASVDPSHVLLATGRNEADAKASLRLTLGKGTTKAELSYVLKVLPEVVKTLRRTTNNL